MRFSSKSAEDGGKMLVHLTNTVFIITYSHGWIIEQPYQVEGPVGHKVATKRCKMTASQYEIVTERQEMTTNYEVTFRHGAPLVWDS